MTQDEESLWQTVTANVCASRHLRAQVVLPPLATSRDLGQRGGEVVTGGVGSRLRKSRGPACYLPAGGWRAMHTEAAHADSCHCWARPSRNAHTVSNCSPNSSGVPLLQLQHGVPPGGAGGQYFRTRGPRSLSQLRQAWLRHNSSRRRCTRVNAAACR